MFFLSGINRTYGRMRGEQSYWLTERLTRSIAIKRALTEGSIGGLFGGLISSSIIILPYWFDWLNSSEIRIVEANCASFHWAAANLPLNCPPLGLLYNEITIATVFVTTLLGCFSSFGYEYARLSLSADEISERRAKAKQVWGAIWGGLLAGIITAPFVTMYFGQFPRPFFEPSIAKYAGIGSITIIALSIVNYSLESFSLEKVKKSLIGALKGIVISLALLAAAVGLLAYFDIINTIYFGASEGFWAWENREQTLLRYSYLAGAGLVYGVVFGPFLGLMIGLVKNFTKSLK